MIDAVVDCAGCTAPCCKSFAVFNSETFGDKPEILTRQMWMEAGAILRFVDETDSGYRRYDCQALVASRCTVYADRPGICRTYDCRNDEGRYHEQDVDAGQSARCDWPRLEASA